MKKSLFTILALLCAIGIGYAQQRSKVTSILEIYDIEKGTRTVVKEFKNHHIEAPNWSMDGKWLIYNSGGRLYKISAKKPGEPVEINTDFATACNNDHVLSFDGKSIAISHGTKEDRRSRVYTLPIGGGTPRLITPLAPSYLPGWSPDGKCWHIAPSATIARFKTSTLFPPRVARRSVLPRPRAWTTDRSSHPMASIFGLTLFARVLCRYGV